MNSIVIVFSITDKESFEHIDIWLKEIDNHAKENVLKFLVGNKCDLNEQRVISTEEAIALAKKYNIDIQILKRDNHMVDNSLMLGQVLRIRINN